MYVSFNLVHNFKIKFQVIYVCICSMYVVLIRIEHKYVRIKRTFKHIAKKKKIVKTMKNKINNCFSSF